MRLIKKLEFSFGLNLGLDTYWTTRWYWLIFIEKILLIDFYWENIIDWNARKVKINCAKYIKLKNILFIYLNP